MAWNRRRSGNFIVNFKHISHIIFLVVNFEQVNVNLVN